MMKKNAFLIVLMISLVPYLVFAQLKSQDKPVQIKNEITQPIKDQFFGLSIFDPAKFSMSHSFAMSYFSLGGKGISQGLYLNTMTYQIASPLLLRVQWGIQNFPYNSLAKDHPAFQGGFFLSGAELQYKPNDKFEMRLQLNNMPGYMYNSYYYGYPNRPYGSTTWDWDEKK